MVHSWAQVLTVSFTWSLFLVQKTNPRLTDDTCMQKLHIQILLLETAPSMCEAPQIGGSETQQQLYQELQSLA